MATKTTTTATSKYSYWQSHINQWRHGGLSQAHYCKKNMLALSTFTYWKKKLSQCDPPSKRFYPLTVHTIPQAESKTTESGLRLVVGKRRFEINVAKDFSPATLIRLMDTLEKFDSNGAYV